MYETATRAKNNTINLLKLAIERDKKCESWDKSNPQIKAMVEAANERIDLANAVILALQGDYSILKTYT